MRKSVYGVMLAFLLALFSAGTAFALSDVSNHWASEYINDWINKGYISGYGDGTFRPDNNITRAEFVQLIDNAYSLPAASGTTRFADVNPGDWYYNAVSKGVSAGFISGYGDGTFKPHNNITREEAAVILAQLLGEPQSPDYADYFTDSASLSWSKGYVGACARVGVLRGDTGGTFRPGANMTRGEAVTCLTSGLTVYNKNNNGNNNNQTTPTPAPTPAPTETPVQDVTISTSTYGPSTGKQTVENTARITSTAATTKIKNVDFKGDVVVEKGVKNLEFDNCTFKGTLTFNGGAKATFTGSEVNDLTVDNDDNKSTEIILDSRSTVDQAVLYTAATLRDNSSSSYGFSQVTIPEKSVKKNTTYNFYGDFDEVAIHAENVKLNLREGTIDDLLIDSTARDTDVQLSNKTKVDYARIDARYVSILGSGTIRSASVNASNVTLAKKPSHLTGSHTPRYDSSGSGSGSSSDGRYDYTVKVVNNLGVPVKDAQVRVDNSTKTTGAAGTVTFRLDPGSYDYSIRRTGFSSRTGTISIYRHLTNTYTLYATSSYSVTVNVFDTTTSGSPLANATVSLSGYGSTRTTNTSGQAVFTGVPAGYYTANITLDGYTTKTFDIDVNNSNVTTSQALTGATTNVTVQFRDAVSKQPIQNLTASLGSSGNKTVTGGSYTFTGVAMGQQQLRANASGYQPYNSPITVTAGMGAVVCELTPTPAAAKYAVTFNITPADVNATITVSKGGVPVESKSGMGMVDFQLEAGEYIYTITAAGYEPSAGPLNVTGATTEPVTLVPLPPQNYSIQVTIRDDTTNGNITVPAVLILNGVNYSINGGTETLNNVSLVPGSTVPYSITANGYAPANGNFTVPADNTNPIGLNITMRPVYSVTAEVYYMSGGMKTPVAAGIPVGLHRASGSSLIDTQNTDAAGNVTFTGIANGAYTLKVDTPPYSGELPVAVSGGDMANVPFEVTYTPPVPAPAPVGPQTVTIPEALQSVPVIVIPSTPEPTEAPADETPTPLPLLATEPPAVEPTATPEATEKPVTATPLPQPTEAPVVETPAPTAPPAVTPPPTATPEPEVPQMQLGSVTFRVSGTDAAVTIYINGSVLTTSGGAYGNTATVEGLAPGRYYYAATAEGKTLRGSVTVKAGANNVSLFFGGNGSEVYLAPEGTFPTPTETTEYPTPTQQGW